MIIQEEKREPKKVINYIITKQRIYGCDNCKVVIDMNNSDSQYLESIIHYNNDESKRMHYCSWGCFGENVKKQKSDYFISLPFVNFDVKKKGLRAKDFFDILK